MYNEVEEVTTFKCEYCKQRCNIDKIFRKVSVVYIAGMIMYSPMVCSERCLYNLRNG